MDLYITQHALDRAKERLGLNSRKRVADEALTAMIYGKRKDNAFIYRGVAWGFDRTFGTLKTVYLVLGCVRNPANRA